MEKTLTYPSLKDRLKNIDWTLLIFLILVLDVKLILKVIAVVLLYILNRDFRFGFRFNKVSRSRLPLFYCIMPAIAVVNWLLRHDFSANQGVLLAMSLFFWGMCILIAHQLRRFAEKTDPAVMHRTITLFFLLNAIVSVVALVIIMFQTGTVNPYQFLGMNQNYFIGTGDNIQGITFDFSLTNALISAMGVVYFLVRRQYWMCILTMCVLVMTGSNFTDLLIALLLIILLLFRSSRAQKLVIGVCLLLLGIFMKVVSPENKDYAVATIANIAKHDSIPITPPDTAIHIAQKQVMLIQKAEVIEDKHEFHPSPTQAKLPGKLISYQQTLQFLMAHPWDIPLGKGAGHFSSKLAFRASGLGTEGGYPSRFVYIDPAFQDNHLALFLYYFTKGLQHHSIINTPHSAYNQALGEYGVTGLAVLLVFYFGFFYRRVRRSPYTISMLLLLAGAFVIDYWFEHLSIVLVFELLLFIDIREKGQPNA